MRTLTETEVLIRLLINKYRCSDVMFVGSVMVDSEGKMFDENLFAEVPKDLEELRKRFLGARYTWERYKLNNTKVMNADILSWDEYVSRYIYLINEEEDEVPEHERVVAKINTDEQLYQKQVEHMNRILFGEGE